MIDFSFKQQISSLKINFLTIGTKTCILNINDLWSNCPIINSVIVGNPCGMHYTISNPPSCHGVIRVAKLCGYLRAIPNDRGEESAKCCSIRQIPDRISIREKCVETRQTTRRD